MAYRWYAVSVGKRPGVYRSWAECRAQIQGVPNAAYKGFMQQGDAISFLKESGVAQFVAPEVFGW